MGAAGLIEIKRRIKSVESTMKITKAMGLVATSKLRKARTELYSNVQYNKLCKSIVNEVVSSLPTDYQSIYFKKNTGDKLYIVLTSDTGLCGGYNNNVVAYLNSQVDNGDAKIIMVGSKGSSYLKKYGLTTFSEYVDIPDVPGIVEVNKIYNEAIYLFKKGEVSEVNIVYTEFVSPIKQIAKISKLLPVEREETIGSNSLIEPNEEDVLNATIDIYLKSELRNCLLNSKASEQGARMSAMDGATENANDILQGLKTKYNRIRQSAITQEITEIVSGAEAQK